ncbi:MAG: ferritin-like domain-containing protein [Polyangiaceae bacterium]|nr:ferritin-like domain-containing protein [Polyangiaceae bacterium]
MRPSSLLRRNLTTSIFAVLGVASVAGACREATSVSSDGDDDGSGAADGIGSAAVTGSSTGFSTSQSPMTSSGNCAGPIQGTACFAWPQPSTTSGGGNGGAGGTGGVGGAGGAEVVPCPTPDEAQEAGLVLYGCGLISVGEASFSNGECCYAVVEGCCGSGRPFLVRGRAQTAAARRSASASASAWSSAERPLVEELDESSRAALAAAWLRDALLEHASVASFARFALELMAVGAPSDLVDAAHEAARDEVRHARSCFAIASAYAGRELAPGPFAFGGAVEVASDLATVAASAVKEGCVGETLAAVQAAVQLDGAEDSVLRKALEEITRDEARHAELAWRFVAWAVRTGGAPVIRAVEAAFEEALAPATSLALPPDVDATVLVAHGRALPDVQALAFAETITETIRPAMRMLIAAAPASRLVSQLA